MKLHQLRDFIAVSEAGGVRAAARALGLSQPSVTKSVQQLESELNVSLFERSGKGLSLTPFGTALLARTQGVMNELHRAEDEIRQLRSQQHGRLSLAMGGLSLLNLLPGALATFRRRYPEVAIRVIERPHDQAILELRHGELDFAVLPHPAGPLSDEFMLEPLLDDRYAIIARRGHPLANAKSLEELLGASWLVTRQRGAKAREFEQYFVQQGLPVPHIGIQCESVIGVLVLLQQTDMLAVMPSRWLHTGIVRSVAQEIMVEQQSANISTTCIVRRAGLPLTPAADAFVAALVVEARSMQAGNEQGG